MRLYYTKDQKCGKDTNSEDAGSEDYLQVNYDLPSLPAQSSSSSTPPAAPFPLSTIPDASRKRPRSRSRSPCRDSDNISASDSDTTTSDNDSDHFQCCGRRMDRVDDKYALMCICCRAENFIEDLETDISSQYLVVRALRDFCSRVSPEPNFYNELVIGCIRDRCRRSPHDNELATRLIRCGRLDRRCVPDMPAPADVPPPAHTDESVSDL